MAVASKKGRKKAGGQVEEQVEVQADDSPKVYTFEMLRNMETLVVTRAISRPEPLLNSDGTCFYVSKSWCKSALAWLEVQQEERKERELKQQRAAEEAAALLASTPSKKGKKQGKHPGSSGKKKKLSRKEQRARDRKMSEALPPWSNVNSDLV